MINEGGAGVHGAVVGAVQVHEAGAGEDRLRLRGSRRLLHARRRAVQGTYGYLDDRSHRLIDEQLIELHIYAALQTFARNTRVEALPTFLLVRKTILERVIGVSKDELRRSIEKHISSIAIDHCHP